MPETTVGRRPFHAFLSHAHVDKQQADEVFHFLNDVAGIPVWYDAANLPPGATIADHLHEAIENSRSAIILLSRRSVTRGWVQQEFRAALNQQARYRDFRIIPLRLDDVEPPNFLGNYSNMLIGPDGLDAPTAAHVLKALYQPVRTTDLAHGRHTYLSRGWQVGDVDLADLVCGPLSQAGLSLVGDAEDRPNWDRGRVTDIIAGCGAFAAVLPLRPQQARSVGHTTSKYVLQEWALAVECGLPCLVVPHADVELPSDVREWPGLVPPTQDDGKLLDYAVNLAEEWGTPKREPYIFYATDFGADGKQGRTLIKDVVEATTALPCRLGEYVVGSAVQREILRNVTGATMLIADVSGGKPNVYIEIGAALAASVPVTLLRQGPPGRPAFMLRDQQVWDYASDVEMIGRVARVSYPYRRFLVLSA